MAGLALSAGLAAKRVRARFVLAPLVAAVAGGALWIGVSLGQHTQAQAVGAVLCTSCVGIETARTDSPRLSSAQGAAIDRVAQRIELLVFYAEWCRSCPYAEALADLVAARNDRIIVRHVDADAERELAVQHGITRSGRTVVPAIVRVDTGEVLFGVENLGDRLVELLGEGA
jgi:thiol-disulfide isomerase/thioredoxin